MDAVETATGEAVFDGYQCGKCTAGSPPAEETELASNQILRLLQLGRPGMDEQVPGSLSICKGGPGFTPTQLNQLPAEY